MPKLSERIELLEKELVEKKDALVEATQALEAAPDEESLLVEVEAITEGVEQMEKNLAALKKAEKALAIKAATTDPAKAPAVIQPLRHKDAVPGDIMAKHATVAFLAFCERKDPRQVIQERYEDVPGVKATWDYMSMVQKAAIDPAMTTVDGWAAELVESDMQGFMAALEETSVCAAFQRYGMSLNFNGYGSITIPKEDPLAATPTEPAWVAEGQPIPVTMFGYGSETINRYKLAAIVPFTKEIAQRSTPAIEGLLRTSLRKAYSKVLDQAFLSNVAAVAETRPAGIMNGVTPIAGEAGGGDAAVRADILALLGAMTACGRGEKPVMIMNKMDQLGASMMVSSLSEYLFKDELASGQLMSIPVISSGHVPQHTLILVDADVVACAFDAPMFDVSETATIVQASADAVAPTMAGTPDGLGGGTPGEVAPTQGVHVSDSAGAAAVARSLWQTWSVGLRLIAPTSFKVLDTCGVQASTDTSWTA